MKTALLSLAALLLAGPVQADLLGRYSLPGNNTLEIYYQDDRNIRVNLTQHGYMLFSGDQMFMVMQKGGMQMAMDLEQMGNMVSSMGDQALGPDRKAAELVPRIEDTGRHETVAGYSGRVHQVTVGQNRTEVVLTKDPEVAKITSAFTTAMGRVGDVMSPEDRQAAAAAIEQLESTGYGGLLKQSDGVQLQSIEEVDRPDSFYRLPPNTPVFQMPMMNQSP
jgi:hypothetical protein